MARITVLNHVTLDGVMQAPGAPDEDLRDGFAHGGWAVPYGDRVMAEFMGDRMAAGGGGALLLGRRTYEGLFEAWHGRSGNPFTEVLDRATKFVASRTLQPPLPWMNSILLDGDAVPAVEKLKGSLEDDLLIMGSGVLIRALMERALIDTFILTIHPLVLGSGRRLFADGTPTTGLRLKEVLPTTTGVMISTFEPGEVPRGG
jgi:dihydrofolate reductase